MSLVALFDSINEVELLGYVSSQQKEHLHLDFKTIKSASLASSDWS